jgi:hypothetical protein
MSFPRVLGRKRRSDRHGDRGAAAVEFALVLPILVLIIFGIVDFGRLLHAQIVVSEAAREATRVAALVTESAAVARADEAAASLDPTGAAITTDFVERCPATPDPARDTKLTVSYDFKFVTPVFLALGFGGSDGTLTVSSTSVMPCLR